MKPKVMLGNHWCHTYRGGEKVLAEFRLLFPGAPLYTMFMRRGEIPDWILGSDVDVGFLSLIPAVDRIYQSLLPLFPLAVRLQKVGSGSGIFLNSDASLFKAVSSRVGYHVCYCHSPPRYLWEDQLGYLASSTISGRLKRLIFSFFKGWLRRVDYAGAERVDFFIANSIFVQERIKKFYGRDSVVIYPPVSIARFTPTFDLADYYVVVSQLVPYKRIDIAVAACSLLGRNLIVVGSGTEEKRLRLLAGPTVSFRGRLPDDEVCTLISRSRAFLYPQVEDFGITAVEAQAAGRPVIAFRKGGAIETVVDGLTGLFFDEQSADSLANAIVRFESLNWSSVACRENAERFGSRRFRDEIWEYLTNRCPDVMESLVRPLEP